MGSVHTVCHLELGREGGGRPPISVGLPQLGSHAPAGMSAANVWTGHTKVWA